MSIDEIGAAVATTGPALYRYFRSKESLLVDLLLDTSGRLLGSSRSLAAAHRDDPTMLLTALVELHTDFSLHQPELLRIYEHELANLPDGERHHIHLLQRCYLDVWVHALKRVHPTLPREEALLRTHAVFGLLNSAPHRAAFNGQNGKSADEHAATAVTLRAMALAVLCATNSRPRWNLDDRVMARKGNS